MLKFTLFLMMLHALPETHNFLKSNRRQWLLTAPARVRATRGSCLVIPCSYSLPKAARDHSIYNGLWKKGTEQVIVAHSRRKLPHQDYRGRTRFLGSMYKQNCTWMLWDVRNSDAGLYFFRIHLPEYWRHSWYSWYSWSYQPTELQVVGAGYPEVKLASGGAGGGVLAYCSVTYSCPRNPPTLTWNSNGTALRGSNRMDDWQWMTYSVLHFRPQQNTTLELRCTVTHHGGQKLYSIVHYGGRNM